MEAQACIFGLCTGRSCHGRVDRGRCGFYSDLIRWSEAIWDKLGRRKALWVGTRTVVAVVLTLPDNKGWITLRVSTCTEEVAQMGAGNGMLRKDEEIRRRFRHSCAAISSACRAATKARGPWLSASS